MKVLLTGRSGQVGWELERLLEEVVATDRATLDLAGEGIPGFLSRTKPDVIINAAAYTAVDRAESEREAAFRINATAPGILAEEAKRLGALLVHFSTDYVFDGEKKSPYLEDDRPSPLNVYGESKLEGEKRVRASGCRHLILRTSWVYAPRGRNFFLTMKNAKQPLRVVDDQRGVPTSSRFLAEYTISLLGKNVEGVLHLVPSGETTWYGFARAILGESAALTPIRSSEYPTPARRPANSVLDNRKAAALLGALPDWRDVLSAVR